VVDNVTNWKELLTDEIEFQQKLNTIKQSILPTDLATIIYTSGTTGIPKGVMLSHQNIVTNVKDCLMVIPLQPREIVLSFLPLSHVFERTINYVYFAAGVSVYFADGLETISEHLQDIRPHYFATVPRLLERVYEKIIKKGLALTGIKKQLFFWSIQQAQNIELGKPKNPIQSINLALANKLVFSKWREALGGRIKAIICGSAPLQPRLATIFTNAQIPVLEGYGLTECSPVVSVVPLRTADFRAGSVGKPLPSVQIKIEEDGEILVKAPNVMMGYYKNIEETQKVFNNEGWLLTGDIGKFTEDGFLKITDRKKELFKTSGGKYVAPSPIENKLKESIYIDQVALVGDGEKFISAFIIPNFDNLKEWCFKNGISETTNDALIAKQEIKQLFKDIIIELNVNFGKVEQVKQIELLNDEWTVENGMLTATLKLRRKVIKEKYIKQIDSIYHKK
jgi:long-chain acyl-CoA synthetase